MVITAARPGAAAPRPRHALTHWSWPHWLLIVAVAVAVCTGLVATSSWTNYSTTAAEDQSSSSAPAPTTDYQIEPAVMPTDPPSAVIFGPVQQAADPVASALAANGIPQTALDAYQSAAEREQIVDSGCGLSWPLLAAIGRVESDHGQFGGSVLYADGESLPHIIGPQLNGHGTALVWDTDHGVLDGDKVYDRAVGPMQFIPSTWKIYGVDANGDGVADPFNIYDAAAAAADYLCVAGGNLTTVAGQTRAVFAYNHSESYVQLVLKLEAIYAQGVGLTVPVVSSALPPAPQPTLPPVNPGAPLSTTAAPAPSASATSTAPGASASNSATSSPTQSSAPATTPAPSDSTSSSGGSSSSPPTTTTGSTDDSSSPSAPGTTDSSSSGESSDTPPPTSSPPASS